MITLPIPPRRAELRSFWLLISVIGGLLIGVFASLLVSPRLLILGVIVAPVLALPGLLRPQVASIPYKAWNKLARVFVHYARLWLMYVCFYIIFLVVGRAGSSLRLTQPGAGMSMWVPRKTQAWFNRSGFLEMTAKGSSQRNWITAFLVWAIRSGNWWACCLLPFIILLSALEGEEEESAVPTGIYTLF